MFCRRIGSVFGCSVGACLEWEGVLVLYLGLCRSLSGMGRSIGSVSGASVGACLERSIGKSYKLALQEHT